MIIPVKYLLWLYMKYPLINMSTQIESQVCKSIDITNH